MVKFECNACGGHLIESGKFLVCENCGTKYLLGRDDQGQPFTYQPVEKKEIACGQMGVKASTIEVSSIAVREIKLKDNINAEVHNESLNLDTYERIKLVETYIKESEWEAAQGQINHLLMTDIHCAEAQWYGLMCNKKIAVENVFVATWSTFSQADKRKLDDILANSSPSFAKHITDLMFENAYANDAMCSLIFATILPYAKNELVYEAKELNEKLFHSFEKVISKVYEQAFVFLLTHTLERDEIDKYIEYLKKFANNCTPEKSQKYYQMIIDVDPGNLEIRRKLVQADMDSNTDKGKCIHDFEGLLKYSKDTDRETYSFLVHLNSEKTTTPNKSKLFWDLLGYHSEAPSGLKKELLTFATILLNSALWTEARKYLNLILSVDARNADAYWGLCLARIEARNENKIIYKKDNLIDSPEFHKSLALYQADQNDARVSALMSYAKMQKNARHAEKLALRIAAIVVAAISLIFIFNRIRYSRKYSVNNIVVSVTEKENSLNSYYYDDYQTDLTVEVKNKSSLDIFQVQGKMKIYNSDDDILVDANTTLSLNVESGESVKTVLSVDYGVTEKIEELYALDLENLKITFKISKVIYEGYEGKDYPDSKEKVIHKVSKDRSYKEEKAEKLQEQFDIAIEEYEKVDVTSPTFANAIYLFEEIWEDVVKSDDLLNELYDTAENYKGDEEYEKAYFLFNLLSSAEYKDSEEQANECYDLANGT